MDVSKGQKSPICQGTIVAYARGDNCLRQSDMVRTFRQALVDALKSTGTPLKQVADATGVSYEQLKKVRQRDGSTNVDDAVKVANFFGMTLEEFIGDETATIRSDLVDLYNQLSNEERRYLQNSARGLIANRSHDTE